MPENEWQQLATGWWFRDAPGGREFRQPNWTPPEAPPEAPQGERPPSRRPPSRRPGTETPQYWAGSEQNYSEPRAGTRLTARENAVVEDQQTPPPSPPGGGGATRVGRADWEGGVGQTGQETPGAPDPEGPSPLPDFEGAGENYLETGERDIGEEERVQEYTQTLYEEEAAAARERRDRVEGRFDEATDASWWGTGMTLADIESTRGIIAGLPEALQDIIAKGGVRLEEQIGEGREGIASLWERCCCCICFE